MAEPRRSEANVLLQVRGLNVYYGHSHALQGVDLTLDHGVLSVVGRNGMGKTTLCKAIMGLVRASSGTVRMRGQELLGLAPAGIARLGVGYVPQGRRLWRSLTVDEHLRMTQSRERGAWTVERVYDTFPRLAERRNNGGAQLSGGEQQMLAISRALVTNPHLLIMDEPTEGLAPVIVAQVEEMLLRLGEETDMAILVIEQNIGVATTISENVAIMVNGRVNRIIESRRLAADRELQQRLLGVGRHSDAAEPDRPTEQPGESAPQPASAAKPSGAPIRIYVSNPAPPTRWSQPAPERAHRVGRSHRFGWSRKDRSRADAQRRGAALRAAGGHRRRHARHQGRGASLHPRPHRRKRVADAACRRVDERQARDMRCDRPGSGAQPWPRRLGGVWPRSRRFGRRHGGSVRDLDQAPGRHRGHYQRRRVGRRLDRRAGDARPPDRRAQGADLLDRLRRRQSLCRPDRHHDDVFGHRRSGPELDLSAGARQRRSGFDRDGEGPPRGKTRGWRARDRAASLFARSV